MQVFFTTLHLCVFALDGQQEHIRTGG